VQSEYRAYLDMNFKCDAVFFLQLSLQRLEAFDERFWPRAGRIADRALLRL
jgi:hypothetical protein